ncbi:carbohydrate kinase [Octadecabacter sp. 1_MG-2023]|uniref:carbohydrate kinase family protein n=1 Tax=unclassified Octadecabacter TaxID=196158 RepID=UPI001C09D9E9|nr:MULTISPECIES: carbohydrate kinase [unclassified Octadecabacter]MBU2992699.1 carbohydrate kinase [Octadecabacter sp. B2R22]MDO6733850.1 carbohydrate kinase [Octadecabacter sp. 1_MG-2023]
MILTCGEALIDMLPRKSTEGEDCFTPYPGGAGFNTAIGLGRLGVDVQFFCGMSSDFLGDILRNALDASGVDHTPSPRMVAPCTVAFVKLVDGQATYAFYDENSAMRTLTAAPEIEANALLFGGISLVGNGCGEVYEAMMLREAPRRVTMIDPNIRPSFIKDVVAYRARIDRMMATADVIKLSDEDLHWLEGEGDLAELARGLITKGAKFVCITEGANGVTGYTAEHEVYVPSERSVVVDTVGAGDTFNAGTLAGLDRLGCLTKERIAHLTKEEIQEALHLGVRAAAVTVSRAGANPPTAAELGL